MGNQGGARPRSSHAAEFRLSSLFSKKSLKHVKCVCVCVLERTGMPRSDLHFRKFTLDDGAAAAAAKSLQSCPTLCDPIDGSPPGSPVPGILQAGTLEWAAISFSNA